MIAKQAMVFAFCIYCSSVYCQQATIDSMISVLSRNTQSDTTRVNQLLGVSYLYYLSKPDTAMHLTLEALALSQKIKFVEGEAKSYAYLANVYSVTGDNAKAMQMDLKSLTLHESINDRRGFTADINNIGVDYLRRNEPELALDYFFRAKAMAETDADTTRRMIVMNNIGRAYIARDMMDSARLYVQQSYELAEKTNNRRIIGGALKLMGQSYSTSKQLSLAMEFFRSSIPYFKEINNDAALSETYLEMARLFKSNHALDSAFRYGYNSYEISNKNSFLRETLASTELLSSLYTDRGNIDSAYFYLAKWKVVSDSLFSKQGIQQLLSMDLEEKIKKRDAQIAAAAAVMERRKNLQYAAIAIALVTLVILFFLFSHSTLANQKFIRYMGVVSLLLVFEFLNLLLHNPLGSITHHSPILMLLALVVLAALLAPLHHKIEHWITHQLVEKNKRIRLAAAKKVIADLDT